MKRILLAATAVLALGTQAAQAGGFMLMEQSAAGIVRMPVPVFSVTMPLRHGLTRPA